MTPDRPGGQVTGRACVIGAGSSGIASCQVLHARGIPFDCFEAGSAAGGNWRYGNDNGMSAAYRSLHAASSRRGMQYAAFPMPATYPDYPGHRLIATYLDDVVDHFGFRGKIQFRTEVIRAEPAQGGGWDVTVRRRGTGATRTARYRWLLVASGHHWQPRYPEPAFPGTGGFGGEQLHSRDYRAPEPFAGKRVLVVGIGNSACDIAADCCQAAARTFLAARRGAHIVPKYLFGRPADRLTLSRLGAIAPPWLQRAAAAAIVGAARGKVTSYGLPRPDHQLLRAPPTVSDSLLSRLGHGDITVKPAIDRFSAWRVHFADGSAERIDVVIYCTGYRISFPFLREALSGPLTGAGGAGIPLYRRVAAPHLPGLYFIGLVQPIGATMPIAEAQSHWVADLVEGRAALPPEPTMHREIARYEAVAGKRYAGSSGPPIQVGFLAYQRELRRERRAGARRSRLIRRGLPDPPRGQAAPPVRYPARVPDPLRVPDPPRAPDPPPLEYRPRASTPIQA
ncbi:MAG: NAD(P)-binding domain-containing protein [Actinobacteria bacterium]|nr:NAD(P)-binding domain-containing protein [Actinomycetota bacterium]MBO0815218.1 NAD(P)-binding domain-containing protein [Actinomycetota bacterium]